MKNSVFVLMAATALAGMPAYANDAPPSVDQLQAQISALQAQIDELKKSVSKSQPSWKGAPQWEDKDAGFSFKPRGRIQLDTAYVDVPDNYVANRNLGFNSRVRRIRLGAEGNLSGGFGYKVDVDFAGGSVGFGDAYLTYAGKGKPWYARLGNMETLNGLDQMTSSTQISFLERGQMHDAFVNTRRLGGVLGLRTKDDVVRAEFGLFAGHSIDSSFDNDSWIGATRVVYAPEVGKGRLHLGVNAQHREFQSNDNGTASSSVGAPSTNQLGRYRARPFLQTTDVRFVDTGNFAAKGDSILGVELGGAFNALHFAGEAQWTKVNAYRAGDIATGLDAFAGGSAVTPTGDPSFFGAYGEIGWFFTGETRGYKEGTWNRTKVLKPMNKGGWGALQLVGRVDYLDLNDDKLQSGATNNFATGVATLASANTRLGRGGTQTGYLLGLNWYPIDYVRFMLDYIHTDVRGGPMAATLNPLSTKPVNERGFSTDAVALRAQVDF